MGQREIYATPTAVLVALELRHPESGSLSSAAQAKLKSLLTSQFPLARPLTGNTLQADPSTVPDVTTEKTTRFITRDRTASVAFTSSAIAVETTRYKSYEHFINLAKLAVSARQEVGQLDGVERIGIRYVNEVRAPNAGPSLESWHPWINPSLLGPATIGEMAGLSPSQMQAIVTYQNGQGKTLALRYGVAEGYAVDPAGELKRPTPPPTAFFLLDLDSFWLASDETPEFSRESFMSQCKELHDPVRGVYESLITDKLRGEVLREH